MVYYVIQEHRTGKYWSGSSWQWTLDKAKKYKTKGMAESAMLRTRKPEFGSKGEIRKSVEEKIRK